MKKLLVTGGTAFVSKFTAQYFTELGYDVYALNRNTKPQVEGVTLIEADRHEAGDKLKGIHFDAVLDITAYDAQDIIDLCDALLSFDSYIMISSSAVYSEYGKQPFYEDSEKAENKYWGKYGTDKINAEKVLLERVPDAYILRPPYLYGPMNNLYREAFVFDCAINDRQFFLPRNGEMQLQFFHVKDLCRLMEIIIEKKPAEHILNVGNKETVSVKDWVKQCYSCLGKVPEFVSVNDAAEQQKYFSFRDYEYCLDIRKQQELLSETEPLESGLKESLQWYLLHQDEVKKKPFFKFIDSEICHTSVKRSGEMMNCQETKKGIAVVFTGSSGAKVPVYSSAQMSEEEAKQVCTWRYPGELAVYNFSDWEVCKKNGWDIADAALRENAYFSAFKDGEYFAFFHIMDRGDHIELGVGMKPEECGKHNGLPLMRLAVEKIRELYPGKTIQLTVLTFNKRAVACYESAGFHIMKKYYDAEAFNPGERFLMEYREDNKQI